MARLTGVNGNVVDVSDDKAEVLRQLGYQPVEEPKKASGKKSASSKSSE
jgi:DNA-binding ferritin-like protein